MHLFWQMPNRVSDASPITQCSAVCEILVLPRIEKTYFWALQATFTDADGADHGAAHLGLQYYPPHPRSRAVNWGGYPPAHENWKRVFDGSPSPLPSDTDDANTRNFDWHELRPYRFTISLAAPSAHGWRGTVTDLETGVETHVRDLWAGGDRLRGFVVWSEWFSPPDAPTVVARWSQCRAKAADGTVIFPTGLFVNHPNDGGHTNVGHVIERGGPDAAVQQIINTARTVPHGTVVPVVAS